MPQNLRAGADQAVILRRRGSLLGVEELIQILKDGGRCFSAAQEYHHTSAGSRNVTHGGAI